MKRKLFSAVFIILNALCAASLIFLTVSAVQFGLCFSAAKKIPQIDFQLLRILPYNAAGSEISASVSILDTDGEVLAVIERSWHGSFLSVECICASFSENKLYFPKRIYGAKTEYPSLADMGKRSGRGTALFRYYNRDGACLLFGNRACFRLAVVVVRAARADDTDEYGKCRCLFETRRREYALDLILDILHFHDVFLLCLSAFQLSLSLLMGT